MSELWRILTLQAGYNTSVVVLGTTVLGAAAGLAGALALLRKRVLISDSLAHATLPGLAGAFMIAAALGADPKSLPVLLAGATVTGVLGVLSVQWLSRYSRLSEDAALAVVLSVYFGVGVVLLSIVQRLSVGGQAGLSRFIFGQTAAMSAGDVWLMGGVAIGAVLIVALLFKELRLVCFDRGFGRAQGWPIGGLDVLLLALITLVTVAGLQAVGLILVVALIVTPGAAARFWTDRLGALLVLSAMLGAVSGYLGSAASAVWPKAPAGAVIVLAASAIFVVSLVIAPRRGLLARTAALLSQRVRIQREHTLRSLYEWHEAAAPGAVRRDAVIPAGAAIRAGSAWSRRLAMRGLAWRGLVCAAPGGWMLTEEGWAEAERTTRIHRLWEAYLIRVGGHDPLHADDPADLIEHALDPAIVAELERTVAGERAMPRSPHEMRGEGGRA